MTGRISALRLRSLHVALLAALLLIIGGTQASADPGRTRFKIAWSACENSPQTGLAFPTGKRYEDWNLDDPAGQDITHIRPIRDEIKGRVERLISELQPIRST